jgi:hypothetical protein
LRELRELREALNCENKKDIRKSKMYNILKESMHACKKKKCLRKSRGWGRVSHHLLHLHHFDEEVPIGYKKSIRV